MGAQNFLAGLILMNEKVKAEDYFISGKLVFVPQ